MALENARESSGPEDLCPPPLPHFAPADYDVPPGACDVHAHVVSGHPQHGLVAQRSYTPPPAPEEKYLRMLDETGMSRGVLVQISVYGTDNDYLLQVLRRHPDTLRGVAVVDADVTESDLESMHAAGVRGIRINVLFGGGIGFDALETLAAKIAPLGWHIQLLLDARDLPDLMPRLTALPVPVVVDHMGHMPADLGPDHPGFAALRALVAHHGAWVKLSGAYRIDPEQPDYPAASRLAVSLLETDPARMLYGSDWPHVAVPYAMPDTGHLRNLLARWVPDEEVRRSVLVDNPARLYGFDADGGGGATTGRP